MTEISAAWEVEFTDEFEQWWDTLTQAAQEAVDAKVLMLEARGPNLSYPHSTAIKGSRYPLRELRVQHQGGPLRVLYIFDPRRTALLLVGGDKTGDDRWYEKFVPLAEKLYLSHVETLKLEN
ncbi:MAG: type II toxin-antitoxin system RelE/ParE family toxin [Candidatus Adiutrix sp.]|jgi:hypothetical protein|nr:type II toxin-antitoxin system RelE/ParE family toxin [Candidatus Adiutrix sp.]